MAVANAVGVNALSLIILALILYNASKRAERKNTPHRLFVVMISSLAVILAADSVSWIFDGVPGAFPRTVNWISTMLIFLPVPVIPSLYVLYTDYQVFHDGKRLRRLLPPLAAYMLLDAAFILSTPLTGWCFSIDAGNAYRRGPLVTAHAAAVYAILIYCVTFLLRNRRRIDPRHFVTLLTFGVPPAAAGIVQGFFSGMDLTWGSLVLSMLLLYINIQDKRLDTDYLTGIYNRRLLDSYVGDRIKSSAKGKTFSAILIDMDDFKLINDNFGHIAGDEALLEVVELLKSCLRHGDLISRYGGDEFLIILDIASPKVLEETVERIRTCFDRYNHGNPKPYSLKFSTGYAVYDMASGMDPEQFIEHIDALMYEDKRRSCIDSPAGIQGA